MHLLSVKLNEDFRVLNSDLSIQFTNTSMFVDSGIMNELKLDLEEQFIEIAKVNEIISDTIHIIEDVSSASKEQMLGIEQINSAISMLDKVTQENASEATQIAQIGVNVEKLAKQLVNDANSKKFN